MRFRTLVLLVIWAAALGYVAWTVVSVGAVYLQGQELVEAAVTEAARRHRAASAGQQETEVPAYAEEVRAAVIRNAPRLGIAVDPQRVSISYTPWALRVQIAWPYPAVVLGGWSIVTLPLSVDRSFDLKPAAR